MNKKVRSDSIAFKLALTFVASVVIQSLLMTALLSLGGVIGQSRENAYQIFSEKVKNRSVTIEGEMKNVWTNFELYTDELSRYFTEAERDENGELLEKEDLLKAVAPTVLNALYYTKTTGAFLILDRGTEETESYPALYFRNANPNRVDERNSNTYLLAGPWDVAQETQVVTDAAWKYRLELTDASRAFYEKPFSSVGLAGDEKLLGYWCPPFRLYEGGEEVVTYSIPLVDQRGRAVGVFGVEISLNYLYKYLPPSDLLAVDSYGYVIGIRSGENDGIRPLVTHGALQKRILQAESPMELKAKDSENGIFLLGNHNGNGAVYACLEQMGMYYNNTPFSGEEWYLIGLMEEDALLQYPHRIQEILFYSFLVSLCAGAGIAVLISRWFTRYSRLLELSEVPVGVFEMGAKGNRVYMTNQIPRLLGLSKDQERTFCRSRNEFQAFLKKICEKPTEDENIFCLEQPEGKRWIRLTLREDGEKKSGVVEDVTEEVLKTQSLRAENDLDGLTRVLNRKAFEHRQQKWEGMLEFGKPLTVLMFDLNCLKGVNDEFGHETGDKYIRFSARAISGALKDAWIYRIGGDEFAAVIEGVSENSPEECSRLLAGQVEAYGKENGFKAGIAWGYAGSDPGSKENFSELLSRADHNMYEMKKQMKSADSL